MKQKIRREITVQRTPRFHQLLGKFDLQNKTGTSSIEWDISDLKLPAEWSVGVIVGDSGVGKSVIARELFGEDKVIERWSDWPADQCIGDGFAADTPIDDITGALASVGFSSPKEWLKPYRTLSNGGRFRVDLARTLADPSPLKVVDEFGSLVHQEVRQIAAAAAAKSVRRKNQQLVALCVHRDAVAYFEPDWVIEIKPGQPVRCECTRGLLRRPDIRMEIWRVDRAAWVQFQHHHYLSHDLHRDAVCFAGFIGDQPAGFVAAMHAPTSKGLSYREHRAVVVPDFQGVGLGNRLSEFVASLFKATGHPYYSSTSHPAFIRHRAKSPLWAMIRPPGLTSGQKGFHDAGKYDRKTASGRITAGFRYVGPARAEQAREFGIIAA